MKGGKVQKAACGKTCTLSGLEMWQAGGEQFRGKPFNLPTPPTTSLRDRYRYRGRAPQEVTLSSWPKNTSKPFLFAPLTVDRHKLSGSVLSVSSFTFVYLYITLRSVGSHLVLRIVR